MATRTPAPTRRRGAVLRRVLPVAAVLAGAVLVVVGIDRAVTDTTTESRTLGADGVTSIVVETRAGNVTVTATDRDDVLVRSSATSGLFSTARPDVRHEGDELRAVGDCRGPGVLTCRVAFDVEVPRDLAATVVVDSTAGEISLRDLAADVDVEATAGTVELRDFAGEVARVHTTAGEVDVEASAATRALDLRTTAGSIDVVIDDTEPLRVDASTTVGSTSVTANQSPDADRVVVAETTAGEIRVSGR